MSERAEDQAGAAFQPLFQEAPAGRLAVRRLPEVLDILDLALSELMRMVQARRGNFYFFNESGELAPHRAGDDSPGLRQLAEYCVRERTSINYNKAALALTMNRTGEAPPETELEAPAMCGYLGLQEGDLGVICLSEPLYMDHFYEADFNLIKSFAATFAILLKNGVTGRTAQEIFLSFKSSLLLLQENTHLHQRIKEAEYRLNTVLEVSNLINSSRELKELIQAVLYSARRVLRAQSASMFLVDPETEELVFDIVASKDREQLQGFRIPKGQGIVGLCAREKRSIVVNDAMNDPRIYRRVDEVSHNITRNLMAAPLLVNDNCIGVLEVINTIDRSVFTNSDLEIFESFSDSVAIAVQRRMLLDDLQRTNMELERKLRETTTLHAVAAAMMEASTDDELFLRVLETIQKNLHIQRLSILLFDPNKNRLELKVRLGDYSLDRGGGFPPQLARQVFESNRSLFIEDLDEDPQYGDFASPERYQTGACIILPLSGSRSTRPYGVFCAADPSLGVFFEEDFRLLTTVISQLVGGYENLLLNQQILTQKAMEKEVEITSRIQKNILPHSTPQHVLLELGARSEMARMTGGDFYDYHVHEPNGAVTFLVADVSGKSLPAALFMAISSSILRTIIRQESDPVQILSRANDLLYEESHSGMFVTVFLARYEPHTETLRYASAGHNDMILMRADGRIEYLGGRGHPLGVRPTHMQRYVGGKTVIEPDDLLVLYTDGAVEATDDQTNEEYGMTKFIELLEQHRSSRPRAMIDSVFESVQAFSGGGLQSDDFTMLVTRFKGTPRGVQNYHIRLVANKESVPRLRDEIMQICLRHGISGALLDDILLVSDEAATNIVVHAYADTSLPDPFFDCDLQIETNNFLRLNFRDQGQPFQFHAVQQPDIQENLAGKRKGGFGVYLIKSLMSQVHYERIDGVNFLSAEKDLRRL